MTASTVSPSASPSTSIVGMTVGGVQHLVERAHRESAPMQFVRELVVNAIEAKATRIVIGPEWRAVEALGVYRFMAADNGVGMSPAQMVRFLNTFGGGGKPIGDAHDNFGVGFKTSTLPDNHAGVVVLSWVKGDPDGSMIRLQRDPATGEYGAHQFQTASGSWEMVVAPFDDPDTGVDWTKVKPAFIRDHGTAIVLLGHTGTEDTFLGKSRGLSFRVKEFTKYLNERFWILPKKVEMTVQELRSTQRSKLPRSETEASSPHTGSGPDRRWLQRTIRGAKHFVVRKSLKGKGKLKARGSVPLKDGTVIDWYLWDGPLTDTHQHAHRNGYIAALYKDELYDVKHHHSTFRRFGVTRTEVRERVTLIARPPRAKGSYGVYPDTARTQLKLMDTARAGEGLPWEEWAEEFSEVLPKAIVDAERAAMPKTTGSVDDPKWADRLLSKYGRRWKRVVLKAAPSGTKTVTPGSAGTRPTPKGSPKSKSPSSSSSSTGGTTGAATKGSAGGSTPAKATTVRGGVPEYLWDDESQGEVGKAAVWSPPSPACPNGRVTLNRDFRPFQDMVTHWQDLYPPRCAHTIRQEIEGVYGEAMVARIAHSEDLAKDKVWGRAGVEELRTPTALTMAALGLVLEDHVIATRLGAKLAIKRKSA